jgi:hypothetical protein
LISFNIATKASAANNEQITLSYQCRNRSVNSIFTTLDDKHVPLYRILWISAVPHFCGSEDCTVEGRYEVKLESDESIFGTREERETALQNIELWQTDRHEPE